MTKRSNITPALERIERDIDAVYLRNPLTRKPFSEAAWYFLAFCEERTFKHLEIDRIDNRQDLACFVDEIVNSMKAPLTWLSRTCEPGHRISRGRCVESYQASFDISNLAQEYASFESAYVYARAGVIELHPQGDTLIPTMSFRDDARYEAYDRLCIGPAPMIEDSCVQFFHDIARNVSVSGQNFRYRLNPAIVRQGLESLSPMLDQHFWLPPSWELPRYTFGDFRSVLSVLRVMAMIHHLSRVQAARQGCVGMGYRDSVLLMDDTELTNRLRRYTGLDSKVVHEIVHDVTYGECGIRNPDPALQPLIPLSADRIAVSPVLFLGIDVERNFTVLLNRLPEEKEAYSRLSNDREKISRERIMRQLAVFPLRFWHGGIPGRKDLPDLDLAIIDDSQRTCLLLELKAFIEPAESREVLEKSKEIERGVSQIKKLRQALSLDPHLVTLPLEIDDEYSLSFAVASETFVGMVNVQDESVPVVRTPHLVRRMLSEGSLSSVCSWIQAREYLPVEGQHFEVKDVLAVVGDWKIEWYGIKPLVGDDYL